MLTITSSGVSVPSLALHGPAGFQIFSGWDDDPVNRRPVAAPSSTPYIVNMAGSTMTITCTIYLYNYDAIDPGMMDAYCVYIRYMIEKTWNSISNPGISTRPGVPTVVCNIKVVKTPTNAGTLRNGEWFIAVRRGFGRSYTENDKRASVFYIKDNEWALLGGVASKLKSSGLATALATMKDTMPAHEFGHVLGLIDRYAYVCYGYFNQDTPPKFIVVPKHGHTVPLYVHSTGNADTDDTDYAEKYGWLFNLMTGARPGPVPGLAYQARVSTPAEPAPPPGYEYGSDNNYIAFDHFDPYRNKCINVHTTQRFRDLFPASPPPPLGIGISKGQLACIASQQDEVLPGSGHVFFKDIGPPPSPSTDATDAMYEDGYIFRGTFIGLIANSYTPDSLISGNGFQIVHDDGYDNHRRYMGGTAASPFTTAWSADDKMRYRCRKLTSWNDTNPADASTYLFPGGFINASLDIQNLAGRFSENVMIKGPGFKDIGYPKNLAGLLNVEHLDLRVCIRRVAFNFVQRNIDADGDLVYPAVQTDPGNFQRRISHLNLMSIQVQDGAFTPPYDLFHQEYLTGPSALKLTSWTGLFVPYNYMDSVGWQGNRSGKTIFYTGTAPQVPPEESGSILVEVTDSYKLSSELVIGNAQPSTGKVFGKDAAEIDKIMVGVWDRQVALPDRGTFSPLGVLNTWVSHPHDWYKNILNYSAGLYTNRKYLIALVRNSALLKDSKIPQAIVGGKTVPAHLNITGLDPNRYSIDKSIETYWHSVDGTPTHSDSDGNLNKNRYVGLRRNFNFDYPG